MSTIEDIVDEALEDAGKTKRAYRTKRRHKRRPAAAKQASPRPAGEFAGLTPQDCPKACNAERCVISGRGYCAHPRKGGLQGPDMCNAEALARFQQAQKALGRRMLDSRHA